MHHNTLQSTKNAALRIATGCTHSTSPLQHLHNECKVLPLRHHIEKRDTQLLVKAEDPTHACHSLLTTRVTAWPVCTNPTAYLKGCLCSPCPRDISMARHIHNTYANRVIEEMGANTILGFSPPQVDPSEEWLAMSYKSQPVPP